MLIREMWVTWKNVSRQSLFPTIAVESNSSEVYSNAPFHLDVCRILVLTAGSPVRRNICFMNKKNDTVQMPYNTLIENLFPLLLATIRQGNISHFSQEWQKFNSFISLSYSPPKLEGSGNLGCEAEEKYGNWSQAAKQCHLGVSHRDRVFCFNLKWPDLQRM